MKQIQKVVCLGHLNPDLHAGAYVYCKIKFIDGKLSITGVEGPMTNGDCEGSCGQIDMHIREIVKSKGVSAYLAEFAEGWNEETLNKFLEVWDNWHLNDMVAGSPRQEAFLKANPVTDRLNYYDAACKVLADAGLNPDTEYLQDGKPYKYGHSWLKVEVPQNVLDFLEGLPETTRKPAWV